MKTRIFYPWGVLLPVLCVLVGCSKESDEGDMPLGDVFPFSIQIVVQDAAGNDLLDPETPNSIAGNTIKAIYKGEEYIRQSPDTWIPTMTPDPVFWGLRTGKGEKRYFLSFGEFDSLKAYTDETFYLDWGDGSAPDTITFSHTWEWYDDYRSYHANTPVYLNGVFRGQNVVIIVK